MDDKMGKAVVRVNPQDVFPLPNETAEGYFARMSEFSQALSQLAGKDIMGAGAVPQPERITKDVAETRAAKEPLARTIAREVMSDRETQPVKGNLRRSFVLDAAKDIVYGPREHMYGHASVNFDRTAVMWEPIFGTPVSRLQVGLAMILLKVARGGNLVQREAQGGPSATFDEIEDTMKDIAGYAEATMRSLFETPDGDRIV